MARHFAYVGHDGVADAVDLGECDDEFQVCEWVCRIGVVYGECEFGSHRELGERIALWYVFWLA